MKKKNFYPCFSEKERNEMATKYKFLSLEEKMSWHSCYQEMVKCCNPYYCYKIEENFCYVIASLGKEIDLLEESYQKEQQYLKCYSLDCLSMEFLKSGYEHMQKEMENYGYYIEKWLYTGSHIPIEEMEHIFQKVGQKEVYYNEAFSMIPKKSVAMKLVLTKEKIEQHTVCEACQNKSCLARQGKERLN